MVVGSWVWPLEQVINARSVDLTIGAAKWKSILSFKINCAPLPLITKSRKLIKLSATPRGVNSTLSDWKRLTGGSWFWEDKMVIGVAEAKLRTQEITARVERIATTVTRWLEKRDRKNLILTSGGFFFFKKIESLWGKERGKSRAEMSEKWFLWKKVD